VNRVALLDVNVLVALFDPDHVHHELAHDWFADHRDAGWATCPLTENGFVRVLANPAYASPTSRPDVILQHLRRFCSGTGHQFWDDGVSLRDERLFDTSVLAGHRQVTDVYLLGLAVSRRGRLATFDRGLRLSAVRGARPAHLAVIGAAQE
jgi:toxin-antitoxin system PIN domain toxin